MVAPPVVGVVQVELLTAEHGVTAAWARLAIAQPSEGGASLLLVGVPVAALGGSARGPHRLCL